MIGTCTREREVTALCAKTAIGAEFLVSSGILVIEVQHDATQRRLSVPPYDYVLSSDRVKFVS